jgi:hypothetical protein
MSFVLLPACSLISRYHDITDRDDRVEGFHGGAAQ